MVGAGVVLMAVGRTGVAGQGLALTGLGTPVILIGVSPASTVLGRPVLRFLGLVFHRVFGTVGDLATQNSLRNPRRTAATASALMVGLALVALMSVLGQSAKVSTARAIDGRSPRGSWCPTRPSSPSPRRTRSGSGVSTVSSPPR